MNNECEIEETDKRTREARKIGGGDVMFKIFRLNHCSFNSL